MIRKLWPFFKEEDERWEHLDNALTHTFGKVKQDTQNLFAWVSYFHQHMLAHRRETHALSLKFEEQDRHMAQLKNEIALLQQKVQLIDAKPAQIVQITDQVRTKYEPSTEQIRTESEPNTNQKRSNFETRILHRILKKKKPYIMQKIMESIDENELSTKELERVIVDEKGLCGRTTFYDYLRELRIKKQVRLKENEFSTVLVRG